MLVIDPDECIDCAVCVPECPVSAIYAEEDVPKEQKNLISINKYLALSSEPITRRKSPLASASTWKDIPGKGMIVEAEHGNSEFLATSKNGRNYQDFFKTESLTPADWNHLLKDDDPVIRLMTASRPDFEIDKTRLVYGLKDRSDVIRRLYVRKGKELLSGSQIDNLLKDSSEIVRLEVVNQCAGNFSVKHFDAALNDKDAEVRLAAMRSPNFFPVENQIIRGLSSESNIEVKAMLGRLDGKLAKIAFEHPSASVRCAAYSFYPLKLSQDVIQAGLEEPDLALKMAVIQRSDFKPSQAQFESIVKLGERHLVEAISRKADAQCLANFLSLCSETTCAQVIRFSENIPVDLVNRCLADSRSEIVLTTIRKVGRKLTQKQLGICLNSVDFEVRQEAIIYYGIDRLPLKHLSNCLQDSNEFIRAMVAGNSAIELTPSQLEILLQDRALRVRLAVASRRDFAPNKHQYKRGLTDKAAKVREIFSSRFKISKEKILDKHKKEVLASSEKLHQVLDEISKLKTWTSEKFRLKEDLNSLLALLEYTQFKVDARNAWLSQFGEHKIIDVPQDKRGHLRSLRGKKVHLICLGQGRYSTIFFAARAVELNNKKAANE